MKTKTRESERELARGSPPSEGQVAAGAAEEMKGVAGARPRAPVRPDLCFGGNVVELAAGHASGALEGGIRFDLRRGHVSGMAEQAAKQRQRLEKAVERFAELLEA